MARYTILVQVPDSADQEAIHGQLRAIGERFIEDTAEEFKIPMEEISFDVQPEAA